MPLSEPVNSPGHEAGDLLASAWEFVQLFAAEHPESIDPRARFEEITAEVERHGSYEHTPAELEFGARVAWRNASRCIGRLYWQSLTVRDMRALRHPGDIAEQCVEHLRVASNRGHIRPVITIFAPDRPGRPAPVLLNEQLMRYADDPLSLHRSELARKLGWRNSNARFEVLPLMVQPRPGKPPELFEIPDDAVLEVPLTHPEHGGFADLGLRWYAVPAVSDMTLEIGGIVYPAAPFNGWYMGTEIGSRNLGDVDRYNTLPTVAALFGLDTRTDRTLWKDRALVELNRAVLSSFQQADVTIADHHTESARFLAHVARERRHGRRTPTDWSWIVPPLSSSATAVFHHYYDPVDLRARPAFLHRAADGNSGCPARF